jgi:hypothetical protein
MQEWRNADASLGFAGTIYKILEINGLAGVGE